MKEQADITSVRRGDIVHFKSYSLHVDNVLLGRGSVRILGRTGKGEDVTKNFLAGRSVVIERANWCAVHGNHAVKDEPCCPKCKHHNALLGAYVDGISCLQCRDCGYNTRALDEAIDFATGNEMDTLRENHEEPEPYEALDRVYDNADFYADHYGFDYAEFRAAVGRRLGK